MRNYFWSLAWAFRYGMEIGSKHSSNFDEFCILASLTGFRDPRETTASWFSICDSALCNWIIAFGESALCSITPLQDVALRSETASRRVHLLHAPFGEGPAWNYGVVAKWAALVAVELPPM